MGSMKSMFSLLAMTSLSMGLTHCSDLYMLDNKFSHMNKGRGNGSGSRNEDNINKKLKQLGLDGSISEDLLKFMQTFARHVEAHKNGTPIFTIRGFNVWGLTLRNADKKLTKMLKDCGFSPYLTAQDITDKLESLEAETNEKSSNS